jgi:DNA repair protein RadA/Sms
VRSIPQMEMRIKEMAQLNYKKVVTSEKAAKELRGKFEIEIIGLRQARDLDQFIGK